MSVTKELEEIVKIVNSNRIELAFSKIKKLKEENNNNIDVIYTFAQIAQKANYIEDAIESFERILENKTEDEKLLSIISKLYIRKNNTDKALVYINKILSKIPYDESANKDKAYILYNYQKYREAKKYINIVIEKSPKDYFALNINGLILLEENNILKAKSSFEKAIKINQKFQDSYLNLGVCYYKLEDFDKAFKSFKYVYKENKNNISAILNIANLLSLKGKNLYAISLYEKILNIDSNNKIALSNLALSYFRLKDLKKKKKYFRKSIEVNPNDNELMYSYSTMLINLNYFKEGLKYFDKRLLIKKNTINLRTYNCFKDKVFNISSLKPNERIFVLREQGIGEEILFSSVYKDLLEKFHNVKIEADKRLISIFNRSFDKKIFFDTDYVLENKNLIRNYDKIIYAGSLIKFFRQKETDFKTNAFIIDDKDKTEKLKKQFINEKKIIVGISWRSKINIFGKLKSLKIEDFKVLFNEKRLIINLQYGDINKDKESLNKTNNNLVHLESIDLFNDLESCISLLKNLDYFVTVSNSTAHLAGALGIKTILIVPNQSSSYYYWDLSKNSSIWYKSIKVVKIEGSINKTMAKIHKIIV